MYTDALCSHILRKNKATHIQIDSTSHCFTLNTLIVISPPQIQAFLYSVSQLPYVKPCNYYQVGLLWLQVTWSRNGESSLQWRFSAHSFFVWAIQELEELAKEFPILNFIQTELELFCQFVELENPFKSSTFFWVGELCSQTDPKVEFL